ncbi:penicillin-binding protein 2 [Thiocapsa imhoffii]|uniref:Peptidoglycan D,D-transpeptidase MrdA n=2 Tax=Thiocapsa imhoffii TaxID=382777 RepID=A0A9X0WLA2_9GAMM|nr:penicillin-binding protein 2 [Thiocapsa imhoffii]
MMESRLEDRKREVRLVATRALIAALLVISALAAVIVRLVHLQIDQHEHFSVLSQDNRVKVQPLPPARGLIYDAAGVLLADNHPSFSLEITIEKVADLEETLADLARLIRIEPQDLARFERQKRRRMRFQPVPIRLNLTESELARFAVDAHRFVGVEVRAELIRTYPRGEQTAHVLGYVGRINEQELARIDRGNYAGTQFIGKSGVEKAHEALLHGQVGYQQVEVNARGRVIRTLESRPPVSGQDLYLYLDIALQQAAQEALGDERGAVVAIDPRNGGVLALVSNPSFDPNLFVEGISQANYQALLSSPDKPLYNRAVRGQYPPGSTIKPFVGLAGLASGITTERRTTFCPGHFSLPGHSHRFRCWKRGGHGAQNLEQGIVQSCDVYFYDLANRMGIDRLSAFLSDFGFGQVTGIDVAGELGGLMPTREWKRRTRNQPWYPGETLIVGIGQGSYLATPLQLAVATAAVANHGQVIQPRVVRAAQAPGDALARAQPLVSHRIALGEEWQWQRIVDAMAKVVEGGTARRIRTPEYRIAGKTGTSQVFSLGQNQTYNAARLPKHLHDHALFVAFAPVDDPRIAIAVIIEHGGGGGAAAAPVARRIMDAYLLGSTLAKEDEEGAGG